MSDEKFWKPKPGETATIRFLDTKDDYDRRTGWIMAAYAPVKPMPLKVTIYKNRNQESKVSGYNVSLVLTRAERRKKILDAAATEI